MPQTFEKIAAGIYSEGLAVGDRRNVVWYSDGIAGGIHGVMPEGKAVASFNPDRMWTGVELTRRARFYFSDAPSCRACGSNLGALSWAKRQTD